jgi:hypothetical protein
MGAFAETARLIQCVTCGASPETASMIEVHEGHGLPIGFPVRSGTNMKL